MAQGTTIVMGIDVSDRYSHFCALDAADGEVLEEGKVLTRPASLKKWLGGVPPMRIVIETGTHANWIARLLRELGHEVLVADARRLRCIYEAKLKDDKIDARMLAKVGRLDPSLLHPVRTRSPQTSRELAVLRSRDVMVDARTKLISSVRMQSKASGSFLPHCDAGTFAKKSREHLPQELHTALGPLLDAIGELTAKIRDYDRVIEKLCAEHAPTAQLQQVAGVGPITSLAYVLVIEDPARFASSRAVGPYLGLTAGRDASGECKRQLRITHAGDKLLRRLLVNGAQYVLGPFGPDTDLRRWGLSLASRGGANGKKRAVVAVARKLAVLLHRLWVSGETYVPLRNCSAAV